MEPKERKLVERVLGNKFLNDAEAYGKVMKVQFVRKGAKLSTASSLGRMVEIAFVKGAEKYRSDLWHDISKEAPNLDTFALCKGTKENGDHLFLARTAVEKGGRFFSSVKTEGQPKKWLGGWQSRMWWYANKKRTAHFHKRAAPMQIR